MSDYYPQSKHDYLDQNTYIIINGYIRESQNWLSASLLNQIPSEITSTILSYVDDHFMLYRGSYQFVINKKEFISNSNIFYKFKLGQLQWMVRVHPNGHNALSRGKCTFFFTFIIPVT